MPKTSCEKHLEKKKRVDDQPDLTNNTMLLAEIIKQKIHEKGPITFCDFMEMCLYYPRLGYYTSAENKIGCNGDYYTSPYLTTVFGEMISKQLEEMWDKLGKETFTIVEYGGGTGLLCHSILNQLKNNKELYDQLNYCIIEKNISVQRENNSHEKLSWHESIEEIAPVVGCILSNELIDNFPVHQVIMEDELMEIFVDFKNDFIEPLQPASLELTNYLRELKINLPKEFRTEINLQVIDWMKEIGTALQKGFVLTIDYGFPSFELYSSRRSKGTILCYHQHRINDCPYSNIGKQDITAHVNFSAMHYWGLKNGLEYSGFTDQTHFLLALGLVAYLRKMEEDTTVDDTDNKKKFFFINSFLMDMGNKLKVLIQHKGISKPFLTGLSFAQQLV
jgi:SAM-dependent MidA family methyltransferase